MIFSICTERIFDQTSTKGDFLIWKKDKKCDTPLALKNILIKVVSSVRQEKVGGMIKSRRRKPLFTVDMAGTCRKFK